MTRMLQFPRQAAGREYGLRRPRAQPRQQHPETSQAMPDTFSKRPEFRNINILRDLPSYRLPVAGWVSILHRVSGALMFLLFPFVIWMFDVSVSSEISFARFTAALTLGLGLFPGWLLKLVCLGLIWAYLHHLIAGLRHLYLDINPDAGRLFSQRTAVLTLGLSLGLTLVLGTKLFGLY